MKARIAKKSWNEENMVTPVVLLSKRDRATLGVDVGQSVKLVHKVSDELAYESLAIVQVQFKEFVGEQEVVCSLNTTLADKLNVHIGDDVEITKELTESEHERFMQDLRQAVFFGQ